MERKSLVAALAMIATFAVFSLGLRSLVNVSRLEAMGHAKCSAGASAATYWMGKVRTRLRTAYPEEAQMLAEMNVPIAMAQAQVAGQMAEQQAQAARQMAEQNVAAARCARATALREAERARRDAMRMSRKMARDTANGSLDPISIRIDGEFDPPMPPSTAALVERVTDQNVRIQLATQRLKEASMEIADAGVAGTDFQSDEQQDMQDAQPQASGSSLQLWEQQAKRAMIDAGMKLVREVEHIAASM